MIDTPFLTGKQYREDELGEVTVQKANWRYVAFGSMGVSGLLILALLVAIVLLGRKQPGTPIEIRSDSGTVRIMQETWQSYVPPETVYVKQLREDVEVLRQVTLDKDEMRRQHTRTRLRMTEQGQKQYAQYLAERKPFEQKEPVVVEILGRPLHDGGLTWDLRWHETTYTHKVELATWRGKFTLKRVLPKNDEARAASPLGLQLDSWSWSKE